MSKKEKIIKLYENNVKNIAQIAALTSAKPSYVAQVLQEKKLIHHYHDLYSHVGEDSNIYSPIFKDVLSFKNKESSKESIKEIDLLYNQFKKDKDPAGQHEAMSVALVGFNRAKFSNKIEEADIFKRWIKEKLDTE